MGQQDNRWPNEARATREALERIAVALERLVFTPKPAPTAQSPHERAVLEAAESWVRVGDESGFLSNEAFSAQADLVAAVRARRATSAKG